jgi:hypothetical protein
MYDASILHFIRFPVFWFGAKKAQIFVELFSFFLQELQKHGSQDMIMALVGNKADLHEKRTVSSQVCIVLWNNASLS